MVRATKLDYSVQRDIDRLSCIYYNTFVIIHVFLIFIDVRIGNNLNMMF